MIEQAPDALDEVYRLDVDDVIANLASDADNGLDSNEALSRLERDGRNELASTPAVPGWRRFLAQFQEALVLLLLVATVVSTGLWLYERDTSLPFEAIAILAVVILNAAMGYVQEARAEAAVAALQKMSANEADVIRNGERMRILAAELVRGDIVLVEEGATVPADARLISAASLQVAEAALTGESQPVSKEAGKIEGSVVLGDRVNMIFSGTAVTYGHGVGVVTGTGMQTEMGRIAGLLDATPETQTPLQNELDRVGKLLGAVVIVIAVVMIGTIIVVEQIRDPAGLVAVLILGVALAVAAVPEGLPAVVTAVLSLGVQRMAGRNAIVRHLAAVETLGSATVIASDKTGTLTRNEMTVRVLVTASGSIKFDGSGYAPGGSVSRSDGSDMDEMLKKEMERAMAAAELSNNATVLEQSGEWLVQGDPTEGALVVAARKAGLEESDLDAQLPRVGEIPFSSERKLMSTLHSDSGRPGSVVIFVKGAPDVLMPLCTREILGDGERDLNDDRRVGIADANESLAVEGLRTLGLAIRVVPSESLVGYAEDQASLVEQDLSFAGLIGMLDPPRSEALEAVARAGRAGIRTLMITGDHPLTATVIARELGIGGEGRAVTGAELESMSADELDQMVKEVSVYARVNPEHKLRIVAALQRNGEIVAMTGDGVNDAPALKSADIGVAMGITGTDVSKEAADVVLADDNFATIVVAVEEGRAIFANIRKFLRFLLSSNIGEVLTMFFGVLLADQIGLRPTTDSALALPLLATQILWINLVTDGAPAFALGMDAAEGGLMDRPPRPPGERVITGRMWRGIIFVGLIMAAGTLYILDASLPGGFVDGSGSLPYAQTMAFTTIVLFQLFNTVNARSDEQSAFAHLFTNKWLWGAIALSVFLQCIAVYLPPMQRGFGTVALTAGDWLRCLTVASTVLWLREIYKLVTRAIDRR